MTEPEDIARVCHEANRAYQIIQNDPSIPVSKPWDEESAAQRRSVTSGVVGIIAGASAEASHQAWLEYKVAEGWVWGPVKNEETKHHPLLVPYDELEEADKIKDHLFSAIVKALA